MVTMLFTKLVIRLLALIVLIHVFVRRAMVHYEQCDDIEWHGRSETRLETTGRPFDICGFIRVISQQSLTKCQTFKVFDINICGFSPVFVLFQSVPNGNKNILIDSSSRFPISVPFTYFVYLLPLEYLRCSCKIFDRYVARGM